MKVTKTRTAIDGRLRKPKTVRGGKQLTRVQGSALMRGITSEKYITPAYTQWLARNRDVVYEDWVIAEIAKQLGAQHRNRAMTWSASSLHKCMRKQIFGRLAGADKDITDVVKTNLYQDGRWRHLRLQANFLQSGIAKEIETFYHDTDTNLAGTADALGANYGIEIKGARDNHWQRVAYNGPMPEHVTQTMSYDLLTRMKGVKLDGWAVYYEHKQTQQWHEFIIRPSGTDRGKLEGRLWKLNDSWDNERLPARLPEFPSGYPCKTCPFKPECEKLPEGSWLWDLPQPKTKKRYKVVA